MTFKRELNEDEKGTLRMGEAFNLMLKSPGWNYFQQILRTRLEVHTNSVMSQTTGIAEVFASERDKGAVMALRMTLNIPLTVIKDAEEIRKILGEDPDA